MAFMIPKGPRRYMVYAWALKGLLYLDIGAHVGTIMNLWGWRVARDTNRGSNYASSRRGLDQKPWIPEGPRTPKNHFL